MLKKNLLKRLKAVWDQNVNDSKSHIWSSFLKNIILGIQLYKNLLVEA